MKNQPECYGALFPDFTRLAKNEPLVSPAFTALLVSQGIGVQGRSLEVKREGWERCIGCAEYRTCYDLSLARLLMGTLLATRW